MSKGKIYYIYDALCGWCYGFTPVMEKVSAEYEGQFEFIILSGGMVTGRQAHPITDMSAYIEKSHSKVEALSGVKFGDAFLKESLYDKNIIMSSEKPSLVLTHYKQQNLPNPIAFAHEIQQALYFEGKDLSKDITYIPLLQKREVDAKKFLEEAETEANMKLTLKEFRNVNHLGVGGFPSVIFYNGNQAVILAHGFTPYKELKQKIEGLFINHN